MKALTLPAIGVLAILLSPAARLRAGSVELGAVDFRFAPPEWQAVICLPDDAHKSLADKSGELLYHYRRGGREFGTRISATVADDAVWQKQELHSPRVPIVKTFRAAPGLEIVEEAFAVTDLAQPAATDPTLRRMDGGGVLRDWAKPADTFDASLKDIAIHFGGPIVFELPVKAAARRRIALALCEGWWDESGKRVQVLQVEGAEPRTIDLVANLGKNKPGVFWFDARDTDGDGVIEIRVEAARQSADRTPVLNGLWAFDDAVKPDDQALLAGRLNARALADLKSARPGGPARNDLILVHVTNTGNEPRTLQPRLIVDTALDFRFQPQDQRVVVNDHETITASLKMTGLAEEQKSRRVIQLEALAVPARKSAAFCVLYSGGGAIVVEPRAIEQALAARDRAVAFWEKAPLPHGRVQVPDAGIQALFDAAVRNIWQAREIKKGLPVFQVGPTCYRGLWLVDGAFLLESAAMVGAGKEARSGITYTLSQQKPSGAFEVLSPQFYKENGIVLWTCARHAMLTQDKAWLASVWPKLEGAAGYIKELRRRSLADTSPLNDGLNPPGEIDGGLSGHGTGFKRQEFSNVHWNLLGLRAFIQAAHWLGKENTAALWQKEYDDLYATFRKAAARELIKDKEGNAYVPIFMANEGAELPQRGQWTFCHAIYPGQVFAKDDPLVASTMAMLAATEREDMVYGTGWDATGIWNYFASFYGHAWLWQGNGRKAAQALYAFANHAAPVLDWREEQSLKGEPFKKVGDMPHNWASAEFIRLTIHLLALDRGNDLHLFEGLPAEWTRAGLVTKLAGVATPFGPLSLELKVAADGQTARLRVAPLADASCRKVVVHLSGWAGADQNAVLELDPKRAHEREIPLARPLTPSDGERGPAGRVKGNSSSADQVRATRVLDSGRVRFQFLKVGEVKPRGWLLEQIRTDATGGYGPVLDKLTDRIELPVFDSRNKSELAKPKIGEVWWNGETTGNWLDGLIRTACLSGDATARRQVDEMVARILAMQQEDAYLGTYPKALRCEQPVTSKNGELWSQTCLFRGLLAYHEFTGRRDVLDAVHRAAKLMISNYGSGKPYWGERIFGGGPGHNLMFVDVCEWLHRLTGDQSYVEFSRFLYDGYSELTELRERDIQLRHLADMSRRFEGHGAHVMEHLRVPLFVHHATGDAKYRTAAENCFPKTARHLSAGGACISDEGVHQRPGSPNIGCEYCTMLELLNSLQSGVQKTSRAPLGDWIEVLAFNSAEGARQRDGKAIQYCTADNQYQATRQGAGSRFKLSPTHDDVAVCCPVTALKFFPYFVNHLWMKTAAGDGLVAVNYAPNELETTINGVKTRIDTDTAYPFEDELRMTVTPAKPVTFALRLRVPGWAGGMKIVATGAAVADVDGWRVVAKEWRPGDRITISFSPDLERKTMPNGEIYWKRGPLVFALPIASERRAVRNYAIEGFADYEYTPAAGAFWDYAMDEGSGAFRLERTAAKSNPWAEPPLRLSGTLFNRKSNANDPVELVPMGASILRRTAFANMRLVRALQGELNLARKAKAEVPSCAAGYQAQAMVDGVAEGFPNNLAAEWASKGGGVGTKIKLLWPEPVSVGSIWLFDRPNPADHVRAAQLNFSDGSAASAGELPNDGAVPFKLSFPEKTITWLEIVVTQVGARNRNAGFAEIAVFRKEPIP